MTRQSAVAAVIHQAKLSPELVHETCDRAERPAKQAIGMSNSDHTCEQS